MKMEMEQPLTQERYVHYLENKNREIRKEAFTNLYSGYKGFANTIAGRFDANVVRQLFLQKNANTVLLWKQHWMAEIFQSVFILI